MEGVSAPTNPIRQTLLALLRPSGVWRNEQAARQRADKCTSINHSMNFVGCSTGRLAGFAPEDFVHMSRRPSHEGVEVRP
jgi:hypothetical protein